MIKTIIVADDMTGANVSNSLLAKNGLKVGTLINSSDISSYSDFDAFGVHTDSRGLTADEAYKRVFEKVSEFNNQDVQFFNKRIDSTLRGNLGSEIDGMLDALSNDEMAIVVSSFPNSSKIVVGGYMLVNGDPLEKTDVANDPTTPVTTSRVTEVLEQQTKYNVGRITLDVILQGKEAIEKEIKALHKQGVRIISIDASTNEEIDTIACAVLSTELPFIAVDPGPFTEALVMHLVPKEDSVNKQKILFVIGSVSTVAISQIATLRAEHQPFTVKIATERLIDKAERVEEIQRVVQEVEQNLQENQMFLITSRIEKEDKLDLAQLARENNMNVREVSATITEGVAEIANILVNNTGTQFGGLYTSGGDITQAFLDKTQTQGIEIKDEIIPLAVYGRVMSGVLDGRAIITKGGLIGNETTLVECAEYLLTKISTDYSNESTMVSGGAK